MSQEIKNNNYTSLRKIQTENKIKTTNVNILLNRVRLDQKRDFKKKLILFSICATILSSLVILVLF